MDVYALPPRPDLRTGLPRPPHAPLERGWQPSDDERSPSTTVAPPPGQGPLLEYHRSSKRNAIGTGVVWTVLAILFATLRGHGLNWVTKPWAWTLVLLILSPLPVYYLSLRGDRIMAGADWMQYRKRWVRTYELTSVTIKPSGPKLMLQMVDRDQRKVRIPLYFMQMNRELWDLVYNGILHSVCIGHARTDTGARNHLKLPRIVP